MDELTPEERDAVLRLLRNAIDADRFQHSDRVRIWKAALAKLDPALAPKPLPPRAPLPWAGRTRGPGSRR